MIGRRLTWLLPLLLLAACGADEAPAGAGSPGEAVETFAAVAGKPTQGGENLREACRQLSPDVRPAMRFSETVTRDERNCVAAMSLTLYMTGENSDVPPAKGFTADAGEVVERGDHAFVSTTVAYRGGPGGKRTVNVLTVHDAGGWWIASPHVFNPGVAPLSDAELLEQYRELRGAARAAETQAKAGDDATTELAGDAEPCPSDGASSADDPRADVTLAQNGHRATEQRPSADLVQVEHNGDGDRACFALRYAGDAPKEGAVEFTVRPTERRVQVQLKEGRVIGQRGGGLDRPVAVRVDAGRDGSLLVLRVPNKELGITSRAYRWGVQAFAPGGDKGSAFLDKLPNDSPVLDGNDHFIPHRG